MLLNLDAGELPNETEELWALADVLAVACGGHAGDAGSMWTLAAFAAAHGKQLAAHVSYPDREGFGRRTLRISPGALAESLEAQLVAFAATVRQIADASQRIAPNELPSAAYRGAAGEPPSATNRASNAARDREATRGGASEPPGATNRGSNSGARDARGASEPPSATNRASNTGPDAIRAAASEPPSAIMIAYLKPHGALYHDAARDPQLAALVLDSARTVLGPVAVIGPPRGELAVGARLRGMRYLREGFADRRMRSDGSLVPRNEPDALLTSPIEAAAQARALREGDVDIVCVHGDTPNALAIATAVRAVLV